MSLKQTCGMHRRNIISSLSDELRYRRVLRSIASNYLNGRIYSDEFTPAAVSKLREVERKLVVLAIGAFAHDVRCSAAAIIDFVRLGSGDEAHVEKASLAGRVVGQWAFSAASLPRSSTSLFALAAPLRLGLGPELEEWLRADHDSTQTISAWLRNHGPAIVHFESHLRRRFPE